MQASFCAKKVILSQKTKAFTFMARSAVSLAFLTRSVLGPIMVALRSSLCLPVAGGMVLLRDGPSWSVLSSASSEERIISGNYETYGLYLISIISFFLT